MTVSPDFEPKTFVRKVIEACHFDRLPADALHTIEASLEKDYLDRIFAVIYAALNDDQIRRYTAMLEKHPEKYSFDILLDVAQTLPQLEDLVSKASDELFEELTQHADKIQHLMDPKK